MRSLENNPQSSIDLGIVNILVGFAPLVSRRIRRDPDPADGRSISSLRRAIHGQFSANPTRLDPYKNFKFRLKWDGKYVAGVSKVERR